MAYDTMLLSPFTSSSSLSRKYKIQATTNHVDIPSTDGFYDI